MGVQTYSNTGEVMEDNAFTGIAQLDDGSQYSYRTSSWGAYSLEVRIQKIAQKTVKKSLLTLSGPIIPAAVHMKNLPKNLLEFRWMMRRN